MPKKPPVKRRPGRPAGAKTAHRAHVVELRAQCPACHSTRRTRFFHAATIEHGGQILVPEGPANPPAIRPYTHVEKKRATCADCGQALAITLYLYKPRPEDLGLDEAAAPPHE